MVKSVINNIFYSTLEGDMFTVSANTLKIQGISALEQCFKDANEAAITVRGVEKYVVMPIEAYERMRETELDAAIAEARRDRSEGKFHGNDISAHMKRITQGDL